MKSKILNLIFFFVCLVVCGCEPNPSLALDDYTAHAAVTLGLASIDESPAPAPNPKPSDGKCRNCKGVGKVGDGRTMLTCDVCKGTGREPTGPGFPTSAQPTNTAFEDDPEANAIPTLPFKPLDEPLVTRRVSEAPQNEEPRTPNKEPVILMHSADSCGPCRAWIANELPTWLKAGWKIEVLKETETRVGWPWYEITDRDGLSFKVYGPLTKEKFEAAKPKPNPSP